MKKKYRDMKGNVIVLDDEDYRNRPFNSKLTLLGFIDDEEDKKKIIKKKTKRSVK